MTGSGKTNWAINLMKRNPNKNFLYITPYIKEDERVKKEIKHVYIPQDDDTAKLPRVKTALKNHKSVASTHALFKLFDDECISLIIDGNYTLILDEVIEVLNQIPINQADIDIIMSSGAAIVDKDYRMIWTDKYKDLSENGYGWLENMIKLNKVINIDNAALMWIFPPEIFEAFKDVYILTYMFEANIMSNYLKMYNISYQKKTIRNKELVDYQTPNLSKYKDLITIYDGKLNNNLYIKDTTFSLTWYKDADQVYLDRMKNNIYNWFNNIARSKSHYNMWTVYKDFKSQLQGKGYTKGFVSAGCRATNNYHYKSVLAYCINRFHQPYIKTYFSHMGVPVDEKLYALSDMIQWVWRSQIRDDKPISIYVPSSRMRELFNNWLTS